MKHGTLKFETEHFSYDVKICDRVQRFSAAYDTKIKASKVAHFQRRVDPMKNNREPEGANEATSQKKDNMNRVT